MNINGQDRIVYDDRIAAGAEHNFSVEINDVGTHTLPFGTADSVLIGPVEMGTSESDNAQIEIEYSEVRKLVRLE